MIYSRLTKDQVVTLHQFFIVMRKLRVLGIIHTKVTQVKITEFGRPERYAMSIVGYEQGVYVTQEECLLQTLKRLGFSSDHAQDTPRLR